MSTVRPRTVSGMRPTGPLHLGHYFGVLKNWVELQHTEEAYFFVADWHALTSDYADPSNIATNVEEMVKDWVAAGLDPEKCVIFRQSAVKEHAELSLLLSMITPVSWLERNPTYKEQQQQITNKDLGNAGFLCYPVLMAADILLQGATEVPVGGDQDQHVELARTLARRFNRGFGEVFAVPAAVVPKAGAAVRDLTDPARKMAKSAQQHNGIVFVLDEPDVVRRKIRRARTDDRGEVRYAPDEQPGVANLLEMLAVCRGTTPYAAARSVDSYAELKDAAAEAVVAELQPVHERARELLGDPAELDRVRAEGARRAAERAGHRLDAALRVAGLR